MNHDKFLGWLTGLVVLLYIGAAVVAFVNKQVSWNEFSGAIGPIAGLLLGYWVRGNTAPANDT